MDKAIGNLTVFFEDPFWVGVFERVEDGRLSVCKVTFGAEPRDAEVYAFLLENYRQLRFSPSVEAALRPAADSPKRRQRAARQATAPKGVGTKSQQALQLQRESQKTQRLESTRQQREAEQERRFRLKQRKRKEKHRGH